MSDSVRYIPGNGNRRANIMLVGEAPGAEEAKEGLPFVGPSGVLLAEALASIGLDRSDVYITNVVKVRPKDNRAPTLEEVRSWLPILLDEIESVNPALIITLGAVAARVFDDTIRLTKDHGKTEGVTIGKDPVWIAPVYHPSYILRGYAKKDEWFKDFKTIMKDNGLV
jgi:uracil-DNA glycosylase family 4